MSIGDVQNNWPTYQRGVKVTYAGINNSQLMATAIANFDPFPVDDPGQWDTWLHAFETLGALGDAVQVTDTALKQEVDFMNATNVVAALVVLPAPSEDDVTKLISQLEVVNGFIKRDQRFAEALKICKALATNMSATLKK